ncbi:MAG: hypothetical protein KAI35_03470 [Desulfobulbaceae bacterium]|nr:hypothetical protein [Desulfobulbaceae bacterium]
MYSYSAYGLGIRSCIPLPEYIVADAGGDVVVCRGNCVSLSEEISDRNWYFDVTSEKALLYFKGIGVFHLREGREISINPEPGVNSDLFRLYLIGSVMSVLLYQRGMVVLHAGAVEINNKAVAFIGMSGAGKSSTVAALYRRGHGIIADDLTAVDLNRGAVRVFPGYPQIKISHEVADVLGYESESLFLINSRGNEFGFRTTRRFPESELPLKRIYVLSEGQESEIELIRPRDAMIELVRHSVPTRLLQQPGGESHFLQCASLARAAPVYNLKRLPSLSNLARETELLEEHLASL